MTDDETMLAELKEARIKKRRDRRDFFRTFGVAAVAAGGAAYALKGTNALAQDAPSDEDILNFALNLEYLEANFYHQAAYGTPIPESMMDGMGTPGMVNGGHEVTFDTPAIRRYAREIAQDELDHVEFLRTTLGDAKVAMPQIDISADADGSFTAAARAANLRGNDETFDPYANEMNFLLSAFIFEDVGVTAYKGAAPLLTNETYLSAAAGIHATEAYHSAIIRTTLYEKGVDMDSVYDAVKSISDARDSLDGDDDKDQGISPEEVDGNMVSNIAPLDENGLTYSRSADNVLNIVYLTNMAASEGGFFPNGVNGAISMSADNS